jgi:hypothetical protein
MAITVYVSNVKSTIKLGVRIARIEKKKKRWMIVTTRVAV